MGKQLFACVGIASNRAPDAILQVFIIRIRHRADTILGSLK